MSETPPETTRDAVDQRGLVSEIAFVFLAGVLTAIIGTVLGFTAFGGRFIDIYTLLGPSSPQAEDVAVLTVGPQALYLWDTTDAEPEITPRSMLAELVRGLDELGARTIVLDVILDSSQPGDEELAGAARVHGAVVGAERVAVNEPHEMRQFAAGITPTLGLPTPDGRPEAIQAAHANLYLEEPVLFTGELIARGAPPVLFFERSQALGKWPGNVAGLSGQPAVPAAETMGVSLSLAGAWLHARRASDPTATLGDLRSELQNVCSTANARVECSGSVVSGLPDLGSPLHENFELRYLGSESGMRIPVVSASELLSSRAVGAAMQQLGVPPEQAPPSVYSERLRDAVKDRLVFVGRVDRMEGDDADRHATPYSFPLFLERDMAGVFIQAQLAQAVLSDHRVQHLPGWSEWLLAGLAAVLTGLAFRRLAPVWHIAVWGAGSSVLVGVGYTLFNFGGGFVLELGAAISSSALVLAVMHSRAKFIAE